MENKNLTIDELREFEIINIGMMNKIRGGCGGSDQDRMCSGSCGSAGCLHDGCCKSWWDWGGDSACTSSGAEVMVVAKSDPPIVVNSPVSISGVKTLL
jgi:hypothetical protein